MSVSLAASSTPVKRALDLSVKAAHAMLHGRAQGEEPSFLIVDVRRTDIEENAPYLIPGAINLPAQTFQATLPALYPILSRYEMVIFHCSSSNGRGPRCANWYQEELDRRNDTKSQAMILTGGIKAWAEAYPDELVRLPAQS
ncbi:Rhodanese-like domain-containing protein [Dioszegia hungarica]|uniref:Rhodanese-like domain-containing protein n=1 Tax=Dioszegia hungarica TaxID=4972 RepID=A0AA38HB07_9TREE|nr:Rhodanese-like domain-containing protein [Dioszegia hungarica]KAI9636154.1 Rhodanese-like domain-containing protein [Dioszegia hungarica]